MRTAISICSPTQRHRARVAFDLAVQRAASSSVTVFLWLTLGPPAAGYHEVSPGAGQRCGIESAECTTVHHHLQFISSFMLIYGILNDLAR
jgi:hypothetical protein